MPSYIHSFELKELPPSILNKRMHWTKLSSVKKHFKNLVWLNVRDNLPASPLTNYKITCTRFTIKPLDPFDNLPASFKAIIDGLTEAKVIEDDKWKMGDQIRATQVKVKHKDEQKVVIEIEDCELSRMATKAELAVIGVRRVGQ